MLYNIYVFENFKRKIRKIEIDIYVKYRRTYQGFAILDREKVSCKVRFLGDEFIWTKGEATKLPEGLQKLIEAVIADGIL